MHVCASRECEPAPRASASVFKHLWLVMSDVYARAPSVNAPPRYHLMPFVCCLSVCLCVGREREREQLCRGQLKGYVAPQPQHQLGDYPVERIQRRGASLG